MRKLTRSILAATAAVGLLAIPVAGAGADDQVITGSVVGTVSISAAPADTSITLPATAAPIGDITVAANTAYTLSIQADKDRMTQYANGAYSTDADKTLDSPLSLIALNSGTTGGVGATANATTTSATLATNALSGVLSESDTYAVTATQPTTALDPAGSYRIVVTYTATSGI